MEKFELKTKDWIHDPNRKREFNVALFNVVAEKYAFVTKALSFGRDRSWKRCLIAELPAANAPICLDLACGPGDITFLLAEKYPSARIIGLDVCDSMLQLAKNDNVEMNVEFILGDMCDTQLEEASADIVTGGYALRNSPNLDTALEEIRRVLKPRGTAAFLDFSRPPNRCLRWVQHLLLLIWGSFWGIVLHRNAEVYAYIPKSLQQFPDRVALQEKIMSHGFTDFRSRRFFLGIMEIVIFKRPDSEPLV